MCVILIHRSRFSTAINTPFSVLKEIRALKYKVAKSTLFSISIPIYTSVQLLCVIDILHVLYKKKN